ncbi:hypothetical protein LTR17_018980 [Elasticomyces elasticus]|nr:hypothetical protein LTR17_018980 [Elasticomyces elasticus]
MSPDLPYVSKLGGMKAISFRLCDAGVYPMPRTVSPEIENQVVQWPMKISTMEKDVGNEWDEIPYELIKEVHYHRDDQPCDRMAPWAGKIVLMSMNPICLHFITEWSAVIRLEPCGFIQETTYVHASNPEKRSVVLVKGQRHSAKSLVKDILAAYGISFEDVDTIFITTTLSAENQTAPSASLRARYGNTDTIKCIIWLLLSSARKT